MESTRVAIIGAGPIGLEVAAGLKRSGIAYLQFDAGQIGSTIGWWASGTRFFSSPERLGIAGIPLALPHQDKATREDYLAYLRGVAAQLGLQIHSFERVESIEPSDQGRGFLLKTNRRGLKQTYAAERVVAAIGDMHRPRLLGIPGENLPHVSHYLHEPHEYAGRRVLIVGGRNSAVEAAIRCYRVGARVTISHRRAEFDPERIKYWLLPEIRHLIKAGQIRHHPLTIPTTIGPDGADLSGVDGSSGPIHIPADTILLLTGYEMDPSLLTGAGVQLTGENRAPVHNPRTMETNVPGLYVAGTAAAGTQHRFRLFIENCHVHAERILASIQGRPADIADTEFAAPET